MIIRPLDLQVLIPRTVDAGRIAAINEQQSATQQQQLSVRSKQAADEHQRQVQTALSSRNEGKVTTEDLDHEKQKRRRQPEGREEREDPSGPDTDPVSSKAHQKPADPLRGHSIDIKT